MKIMKRLSAILNKGIIATALCALAAPSICAQDEATTEKEITGWGDWKLFLDPGHSGRENQGLWGYSEAEKVLRIALTIQEYLTTYTDMPEECLKLCRYDDNTVVDLSDRSDMANAWDADFYYSIHSDAAANNQTLTLFGGWMNNGTLVEKTPNGGKAYGEILCPNLTNVLEKFACVGTQGNWYDRYYYDRVTHHTSQYPYLSVNRRSNMASLLSEGCCHTIAVQQQLNINEQYKRIEALAGFQSLLKYHGLNVPKQTMLAGIIRNSENQVPINGVTVTVDGKTYTTDTYESVFNKYTKNENLIHNGFYFFEGLTAGETYEITFAADGFDPVTKSVTILEGGQDGTTADFVTALDIEMLNNAPAKVESTSITDASNVSPVYPITITFSRNMDKTSVEEALTINNKGVITTSWENDYTLVIDVSQLLPEWDYKITISGDIAKNSQTGQFLDGDGDGVAGGDYVLEIVMAEPDVTAATVASTYPAVDATAVYTHRPPIRIEFSETLDWNDDKYADYVTVTDKDGNIYEGTLNHAIVRDASVLHFYLNEDLPLDKCFLVSVKGGIPDLSGNLTEDFNFRFLSEYRSKTESNVLFALEDASSFWAPNGSGSTKGLTEEGNSFTATTITPNKDVAGAGMLTYSFDPDFADGYWQIREYTPTQSGVNANKSDINYILSFWLYGDGSNNSISAMLRVNGSGLKHTDPMTTIDFRGWQLVTWDIANDPFAAFTGEETEFSSWRFDSFFMTHEYTEEDDDSVPFQAWTGEIIFNSLEYNKWDETAVQNASISDIELPASGIEAINVDNNVPAEYYNLQGIKVSNPATGIYIRVQGNQASKVFVK